MVTGGQRMLGVGVYTTTAVGTAWRAVRAMFQTSMAVVVTGGGVTVVVMDVFWPRLTV
jgi:hypothetical protein